MRLRLETQEKKIDSLFELMDKIEDEETQVHFSKYICVRISGYLENVVKVLISTYMAKSSPYPIQTFVKNKLKNTTNLSVDKLSNFLNLFSKDWNQKFIESLNDKSSSSLNSIISNRNLIAHGGLDNINSTSIKKYYQDIKSIVEELKKIIKK